MNRKYSRGASASYRSGLESIQEESTFEKIKFEKSPTVLKKKKKNFLEIVVDFCFSSNTEFYD